MTRLLGYCGAAVAGHGAADCYEGGFDGGGGGKTFGDFLWDL